MSTAFPPHPSRAPWKTVYRAAILETDRAAIPKLVAEAEAAVLAPGREIAQCCHSIGATLAV